ncbi:unnamed protein product [Ceutorhynchus assimilis]|uniref:SWIM-type domain-containing protein n=1 Tax=Ceutorhynchus assimilis TaxID=467358 RepID=A0A9N9MJP3_9CUCU|nr:unnamed protein product [Ceutorhynchus assimilis]
MRTTTDPGIVQADSYNLPEVTCEMIDIYYEEIAEYFIAGVRNVKAQRATRESYGDVAVGYVQLKRDHPQCIVKARITPEHKIRKQSYLVSVCIDEECHKVIDVKCNDCEASEGGCKHGIALIFWLLRRHLHPSVTSTVCYWKKSSLAKLGDLKPTTTFNIFKYKCPPLRSKTTAFLDKTVQLLLEQNSTASIGNWFRTIPTAVEQISLHHMVLKFQATAPIINADHFLQFAKTVLMPEICKKICQITKTQSECPEWFAARFGRITASKLHEVAHCHTYDGTTLEAVLGTRKFTPSKAMRRGIY